MPIVMPVFIPILIPTLAPDVFLTYLGLAGIPILVCLFLFGRVVACIFVNILGERSIAKITAVGVLPAVG